ncbi:unnamed protein product [Rangifer tarandus platyrhynchus]|uniref:Uncharacterized protein n=1 Tax=Rangifer tarandus platyrhynchus TaxID=3082113 RepID=A0AC59Y6H1_RANTA
MGANTTLLITIWLEASLHEPVYYLLRLLSLLDMVLCLTIIPKVLAIFWFDLRSISFSACFLQMFIPTESCAFLVMAHDCYVAICHPLKYPAIFTNHVVAKLVPSLSYEMPFSLYPFPLLLPGFVVIVGKMSLRTALCAGWTLLGSDLILIIFSYSFILKAVLRIKAEGAAAKALSTCGSHFILILFFSTVLLVLVITNLARERIPPDVPILLNILHHLIPPALNPIVYGVRTKEIKQGIQKLLRRL